MNILSALWPDPDRPGNITLWFAPSKHSFHFPVRSLPLSDADHAELKQQVDAENWDVYFGLGLRCDGLTAKQQGGKKEIMAISAFVLDVDYFNPKAHKAQNLPKNLDEADPILFPPGTLDPSAIINSGNGGHFYWFFDKPIELTSLAITTRVNKAYKAFQQVFIDRAAAVGWHVDLTATVNRAPGRRSRDRGPG